MRPVLLQDVLAVARVLTVMPRCARQVHCRVVFERAQAADRFRSRFGKEHPEYGTGTLTAVVEGQAQDARAQLSNPEFLHSLRVVLRELAKKTHHNLE